MPDWTEAYIPHEKLTDYLLSEAHAVGKWKADLFRSLGFARDQPSLLEERLLDITKENDIQGQIQTPYGTKYLVDGNLLTPKGQSIRIRTVWIVERSDPRPRFVTAYPA